MPNEDDRLNKSLLLDVTDSSHNNNNATNAPPNLIHQDSQPNSNAIFNFINLESILTEQHCSKQVIITFAAYLGVGTVCFFLVRDQIHGKKTNGILDAVYFCVVTMTTVGYGDLVPHSVFAKLLASVYVFAGMLLVGLVLGKAADYVVEKQEILLVRAMHLNDKFGQAEVLKKIEINKSKYKFIIASSLLGLLIMLGTLFLWMVEGMDFIDAFYCVCSTTTTLDYGDKSFSTYVGRLFAIFWILSSTLCLAKFFLYLAELYTERWRQALVKWVLTRKLTFTDLVEADLDDDKVVSASEFIVYKLKEMGKTTQEDIMLLMERFRNLDVDHSGTLTAADLLSKHHSNNFGKVNS